MKRICFYLFLIITFIFCKESVYGENDKTLLDLSLNNIIDVKGRQGVATNGSYYAVSGSKELYLYTLSVLLPVIT